MPRTRDAIAEANQRCRDLRNRMHEAEQKLQPLREQLRAAQAECEQAVAESIRLARRADVLQKFVTAFIQMTHELASDKA